MFISYDIYVHIVYKEMFAHLHQKITRNTSQLIVSNHTFTVEFFPDNGETFCPWQEVMFQRLNSPFAGIFNTDFVFFRSKTSPFAK